MTLELINVGNAANDGTGDDLREAFIKVNQNFTTLSVEGINQAANIGAAGAGVFANTINTTFNFRRLVGGNNITVTELENTIVFDSAASSFTITGDSGSLIAGGGIPIDIIGGNGITVGVSENDKTITITGGLALDTAPELNATLDANNNNILNVGNLTLAQIGGVNYNDRLGRYIEGFDFGGMSNTYESILDFVIAQIGVDFGSFSVPTQGLVDFGSMV